MKALAYLRVSGKGQVNGDGFTRQFEAIRTWAQAHGVEIAEVFRDEGVSGATEFEGRDALGALMVRLQSNGVQYVLVENAGRLGRDLMVSEVTLRELHRLGAKVIACDSGQDLGADDGDATRTLIRQVLGAVAQFEKAVLVAKLRAARGRIRARVGRCEGRKPYGARPGEEAVLAEMRRLWRKSPKTGTRLSFAAVAAKLNAAGYRSRMGRAWSRQTVRDILTRGR